MNKILLDGKSLTFEQLHNIAFNNYQIVLDDGAMERSADARRLLFKLADEGYPVYGLNRGVGWNKDKYVFSEFFDRYNKSLLYTHALGMGDEASIPEVRAMMAVRLNTALCASTGINTDILVMYREFLNRGIHPVIPRKGSIGNADLATLAHIGLTVIGESKVNYKGQKVDSMDALKAEGLEPMILGPKDGLSIVSSNAHGAALAAFLVMETERILKLSNLMYCLGMEGLNGVIEPLDAEVNRRRGLAGQMKMAEQCRNYLKSSYLHRPHKDRALQDALSFRSSFAVNGAIDDSLEYLKKQLSIQLNSTDDNPCIIPEENRISVSTNFEPMAWVVAIEALNISLSHLSKMIAYRCIKLCDPGFTHLTRFLSPKEGDVLAFATMQKAYTALDAENRALANPSSMDFFAVAGNIEDHATNSTLVADKGLQMIENIKYMLGMEAIHCAQAIDLRKQETVVELGIGTQIVYDQIRAHIPYYDKDRILSVDMKKAFDIMDSYTIIDKVENAVQK